MPFHWCADELMAILLLLPFASYVRNWIINVWRKRHQKPCCRHEEGEHGK